MIEETGGVEMANANTTKQTLDTTGTGGPQVAEEESATGTAAPATASQMKKARRVRVIVQNLGLKGKLYPRGTVTSDPDIVALLGDRRKPVELVD
jgi:hypothetical protein